MKLDENPSIWIRVFLCGQKERQTDRQTDMMKLIVSVRNFAKTPKNALSSSV